MAEEEGGRECSEEGGREEGEVCILKPIIYSSETYNCNLCDCKVSYAFLTI